MQRCRKHLQRQVNPFDVAGLAAEKEELEKKMGAPDFWDDVEAETPEDVPPGYDSWYLPLIEAGESMPDEIAIPVA